MASTDPIAAKNGNNPAKKVSMIKLYKCEPLIEEEEQKSVSEFDCIKISNEENNQVKDTSLEFPSK